MESKVSIGLDTIGGRPNNNPKVKSHRMKYGELFERLLPFNERGANLKSN